MKMASVEEVDLYRVLQVDPSAHPRVIQAAYRALARMYHPDQTATSGSIEMVLVNRAYAVLRHPEQRLAYDRSRTEAAAVASRPAPAPTPATVQPPPARPAHARRPAADAASDRVLPHGRYAGWTLDQLVRHDPDYLRWLARHTSGLRFRSEISRLLAGADAKRAAAR